MNKLPITLKPKQFSAEEVKAAIFCAQSNISINNEVYLLAGEISVYQEWAKSNAEIVERLTEIGKDTTDMRTCILIDDLIKELKDQ